MTFKELKPNVHGILVGRILDLFSEEVDAATRHAIETVIDEAYDEGVDDGKETMRDPAYWEHV